jgi:protein-L-isoaspartate(D-aspartate) O-methyltransferase
MPLSAGRQVRTSPDLEEASASRAAMVHRQIEGRGIADPRVLAAMREVPREAFVPGELAEFAHEDSPLPIDAGQTISQPYIVASMIELAALGPSDGVLEVGAGSGYAAAVMSRIAANVFAVERHAVLARAARRRLAELGYDNVTIYHHDGTKGLPEHAPFDAIIVSAGGDAVPKALCSQLAVGGRLIIPVGSRRGQILKRIIRKGEEEFEEEDHGIVAFVPLIAAEAPIGAAEGEFDGAPVILHEGLAGESVEVRARANVPPPEAIAEAAEPFADYEELSKLTDRYADQKVVLLGEATHGTSEFYQARAWITERLVALHGFKIVAVEADWPDAAAYDAYVRKGDNPLAADKAFSRFPRWMWRNREVYDFLDRLRAANKRKPNKEAQAGFYGLDIYSLGASIEAVLGYLEKIDPAAAGVARERYACLAPWRAEPGRYGRMALNPDFRKCEGDVVAVLKVLLEKRLSYLAHGKEAFFDAEQNARIVSEAERYYRAMYYGSAASWNLRDQHMFETLLKVLEHRGPDAKAVVWAHNSHIGDASFTEMGRVRGEHNLGQLCRQEFEDEAVLVGFGTDHGTVAAASDWDGPMEIKRVRPAHERSFEAHCRDSRMPRFFLDMGIGQENLRSELMRPFLERAIGVIYRPESELASHYFEAEPARQFDAWVWFDETHAVSASRAPGVAIKEETFPFGL